MSGICQACIDGECVTFGTCNDPRWQGCTFTSYGSAKHHTTVILHSHTGQIQAIATRGSDRRMWGLWIQVLIH